MLAPVPSRRRDGKSSFKQLRDYLAREIDPDTGEIIERGEIVLSDNLMSFDTAASEMQAVASEAKRLQADPVFHYVLAWQHGEQPSRDQWEAAARMTLRDLGYQEHQFMVAAHADTDSFHCHVMVNRVHPETFKPHTPAFYKRELDKSLRRIEAAQGWQHSNGLAYWDEEKQQAVAYSKEELDRIRQEQGRGNAVSALANKLEIHGDTASLDSYCRGQVAKDMKKVILHPGVNWQHLHAMLKHHGLGIRAGERGGYTIHSLGEPAGATVRASQVFRDVFAGKANREQLVELLGDFKPAVEKVDQVPTKTEYRPASLKRDPAMREQRRLERAAQRHELKTAFAAYRKSVGEDRLAMAGEFKQRFQALAQESKKQRQGIGSKSMDAAQRKALLSVLTAETIQQRRALRAELTAHAPVMLSYREWVAGRAEQGDNAAIAQLRAFNYADKKKQRKQQHHDDALALLPGIQHPNHIDADPLVWRQPADLAWRVNRATGDVTYKMAGQDVFTDHGRRLTMTAVGSSQAQAILLTLEMARQKYGPQLTLTGSDEFKRRAVAIAVQNRLDVSFSDPALNALKAELAQPGRAQGRQASPVLEVAQQELIHLRTNYEANGTKLFSRDERTGARTKAGVEYRGEIVRVTEHHVIQKTGANVLVAHPRTELPQAAPGKVPARITYGIDGRVELSTGGKRTRDIKREISR